jgi:hypothetical protein
MAETDYTKQLKIENAKLETEIANQENNFNKYDRVNFYYAQDEVMQVYVQKLMTFLYIIIYLFLCYGFYSNSEKYSRFSIILYLVVFAVLPFTFRVISKFMYKIFLQILHMFNNGNAAYLYANQTS